MCAMTHNDTFKTIHLWYESEYTCSATHSQMDVHRRHGTSTTASTFSHLAPSTTATCLSLNLKRTRYPLDSKIKRKKKEREVFGVRLSVYSGFLCSLDCVLDFVLDCVLDFVLAIVMSEEVSEARLSVRSGLMATRLEMRASCPSIGHECPWCCSHYGRKIMAYVSPWIRGGCNCAGSCTRTMSSVDVHLRMCCRSSSCC